MYGINRLTCIPDSTAKIQTSLQTKNNSLSFFFAVRPCLRNFAPNLIFNCKGTTLFSITKQSGGKTWRSSSRCFLYIYILFVPITENYRYLSTNSVGERISILEVSAPR